MIDTFFFALQIIGIAILLGWAVIHDRLREGSPTRGPLAYKRNDSATEDREQDRKERRGLTRHGGEIILKARRR